MLRSARLAARLSTAWPSRLRTATQHHLHRAARRGEDVDTMAEYLPILILFALGLLFVGGSIAASSLLGPKLRPTSAKVAPYECGIEDAVPSSERFPVKFYLVAMIFIIFDIEVIFLYPWAVLFGKLGGFGLLEMALFSVPVVVAFTYLLANGALDWAPTKAIRRMEAMVSESRTSASTIRRVTRPEGDAAPAGTGEAA